MNGLYTLKEHRDELLKAEAGAFIHNIGKLSRAFLAYQRSKANQSEADWKDFAYQAVTGLLAEWHKGLDEDAKRKIEGAQGIREYLRKADDEKTAGFLDPQIKALLQARLIHLPPPFDARSYALGEFVEYQHYRRWYKKEASKTPGKQLLKECDPDSYPDLHLSELLEAVHHAVSGEEKTVARQLMPQTDYPICRASAYEYETDILEDSLDADRRMLLDDFKAYMESLTPGNDAEVKAESRMRFYIRARETMNQTIADTQRPINDVTLWDISHSAASLFKAALAQFILTGRLWDDTPHDALTWRYLWIAADGAAFVNRADRIPDLIGRRISWQNALDQARNLLEFHIPIGNEIYRDERGSLFAVPNRDGLLSMEALHGATLEENILSCFETDDLHAEFGVHVGVGRDLPDSRHTYIHEALAQRTPGRAAAPQRVQVHWQDDMRPTNAEICMVCGVRPAGGPLKAPESAFEGWAHSQKARDRGVCRFCLQRRGRRAKDWSRRETLRLEETIWLDEAADKNQRLALVAGRFDLTGWIKGAYIQAMGKEPTFGRIRRCWETCLRFWEETQAQELARLLDDSSGWRAAIQPQQPETRQLEAWHAYEAEVGGRRIPLCWHPTGGQGDGFFRTCADLKNFIDEGRPEDKGGKPRKTKQRIQHLLKQTMKVYVTGKERHIAERPLFEMDNPAIIGLERYRPVIPLHLEPSLFMVLLPAAAGVMAAERIVEKYQREMCRVKDKLPLLLGAVFFPTRTPIRAVMEAGRRIVQPAAERSRFDFEILEAANQRFEICYDAEDRRRLKPWRAYGLEALNRQRWLWANFSMLAASQQHQAIQSIERTRSAWFGSRHHRRSMEDGIFGQFVRDTLAGAQWAGQWAAFNETDQARFVAAGVSGELADVFDLRKYTTAL